MVLFPNLSLNDDEQLLPGRLFTTRMPRNITLNPQSAEKFQRQKEAHGLHTALVLTGFITSDIYNNNSCLKFWNLWKEKEEYVKYAGADLEAFYRSLGINVINRPIVDFSVPEQTDIIRDVKVQFF